MVACRYKKADPANPQKKAFLTMAPKASPALRRHLKKTNIGKMSKMDLLRYLPLITLAKQQMESQLRQINPYIDVLNMADMEAYCQDAGYSTEEAHSVVKEITQLHNDNDFPTPEYRPSSPSYAPTSPQYPDSLFYEPTSPSPSPPDNQHHPVSPIWAPSSPDYGNNTPPTPLPYDFYLV